MLNTRLALIFKQLPKYDISLSLQMLNFSGLSFSLINKHQKCLKKKYIVVTLSFFENIMGQIKTLFKTKYVVLIAFAQNVFGKSFSMCRVLDISSCVQVLRFLRYYSVEEPWGIISVISIKIILFKFFFIITFY